MHGDVTEVALGTKYFLAIIESMLSLVGSKADWLLMHVVHPEGIKNTKHSKYCVADTWM